MPKGGGENENGHAWKRGGVRKGGTAAGIGCPIINQTWAVR